MIQIIRWNIAPQALPGRNLSDPDRLIDIAEKLRANETRDEALEDQFRHILANLRMSGTWKRTGKRRLPLTERALLAHLTRAENTIKVLDIGASDGTTSLELLWALRQRFGDGSQVYSTDLNLWLNRYRRGPIYEYRASNGEATLVRVGFLGIRVADSRADGGRSSDVLGSLYLRCKKFRKHMIFDKKIPLVHPLVRREAGISIKELDCLVFDASFAEKFTAVRASNVLNLGYFSPDQIDIALTHIYAYLQNNGYLLVSRNRDESMGEQEHGSVWRKVAGKFFHVADFGAGSEIRQYVELWRQHASTQFSMAQISNGPI